MEIRHNISEDCQTRIITDYGSNERSGVFLKVKYQMQEDGSDVGAPAEYYTGDEYEGKGIKIEREEMKVHMKNCKVPDDDVNTLFGEETTSTGTDNGGAVTITESNLTDENESMPKPTSSEKTGTGDSSAASTEAALTGNGNESEPQENEDKGTGKGKKKKKKKTNRTKHQKNKAKADKSGSMATVENTAAAGSTQAGTEVLVGALTAGDCLRCGVLALKICAACRLKSDQISYYCSKNCWDKHLLVHKQICSLEKPPKDNPNSSVYSAGQNESVYGIFLAEDTKPRIVNVKFERKWSPIIRQYFDFVDAKEFLGEIGYQTYITKNTLKPNREVPNFFTIFYLPDKFLTVDSKDNNFVDVVTGRVAADVWVGPILVIKFQGNDLANSKPIDVNLSDDFIDVIDYFKTQRK